MGVSRQYNTLRTESRATVVIFGRLGERAIVIVDRSDRCRHRSPLVLWFNCTTRVQILHTNADLHVNLRHHPPLQNRQTSFKQQRCPGEGSARLVRERHEPAGGGQVASPGTAHVRLYARRGATKYGLRAGRYLRFATRAGNPVARPSRL